MFGDDETELCFWTDADYRLGEPTNGYCTLKHNAQGSFTCRWDPTVEFVDPSRGFIYTHFEVLHVTRIPRCVAS